MSRGLFNDMKITSLAPWFGGKRTLAPRIAAELGDHAAYWEPFAGGFSVIMSKPRARMETLSDLHGDITNLARVVQHQTLGPKLYRVARRMVVSDAELARHDEAVRDYDWQSDTISLDRAVSFFAACWMGRNGECGLKKSERGRYLSVRWSPNGGDSATRFRGAVESIPAWRRRLREVTILRRDAFELLEKIRDEAGTAIYLDPPYIEKSDEYAYDFSLGFMGRDDHEAMAELVKRFKKARVVISYYAHPRLIDLYPGWTTVDCSMNKNMAAVTSGGEVKKAPEVLLINGPSLTAEVAA